MPTTATEILVQLKPPPQQLFDDSSPTHGRANYLRFRIAPDAAIALAARVKHAGEAFTGDQHELLLPDSQPDEQTPYQRLLGDAMAADGALFTRQAAVEAAWAVVKPTLANHPRCHLYKPGTWGPEQANQLIGADCGWHNPRAGSHNAQGADT